MAEILDKLNAAKTAAMKAKIAGGEDEKISADLRLGVLRSLVSEVERDTKEKKPRGAIAVLKSEHSKRVEVAEVYRKAGKDSRAFKELDEARIVEEFLPKEPSAGELEAIIAGIVFAKKLQGTGGKGIGQVMAELKSNLDSFDGKVASEITRKLLA